MKFNDILMAIDNRTKIRLAVRLYGMKFITDYHYGEYYLDKEEFDDLADRRVLDMRVVDGILEVEL
jgi:hypothetical protein